MKYLRHYIYIYETFTKYKNIHSIISNYWNLVEIYFRLHVQRKLWLLHKYFTRICVSLQNKITFLAEFHKCWICNISNISLIYFKCKKHSNINYRRATHDWVQIWTIFYSKMVFCVIVFIAFRNIKACDIIVFFK